MSGKERYIVVTVYNAYERSVETYATRADAIEAYYHSHVDCCNPGVYVAKIFIPKERAAKAVR